MYSPDLAARITSLVLPLAQSLGLSLWGVEVALGPKGLVRIFVENEKDGGVTIDNCAELSRLAGLTLEVEDVVPCAYMLEVSSPGVERVFYTAKQLKAYVGKRIELSLLAPKPVIPGRRKFSGLLVNCEKDVFTLLVEDCVRPGQEAPLLEFTFEELKKVRLFEGSFQPPKAEKAKAGKKGTGDKKTTLVKEVVLPEEPLRPLTPEEEELLRITGGCEAL